MGARSAVAPAIGLWTGLACGVWLPPVWSPWLAALGLALMLSTLRRPESWPRRGALLASAIAFLFLGLARASAGCALHDARVRSVPEGGVATRLLARVDEPPRREGDAPSAILRVLAAEAPLARGVRVRMRLPPGSAAEWADTVEVLARIERYGGPRNPGGFDAAGAARSASVHAQGRAWTCAVRSARGIASAPLRLAMRVRRAGEAALDRALTPAARELAVPLLFGDRAGMSTDTDAALRASGLVHLLALSGLHVAWLAGVARALAAIAGGGVFARAMAGALAAGGYALVAGPIPSLARAVVAEGVSALACAARRAADPIQSLALAPLVLLACAPAWAGDLGFQLSCAATLGLVAIGGPWSAASRRLPRLARGAASGALLTLGAQLAALPLLLARFHALPWTALAGNLAAVPLSEWLLAASALGAGLDWAAPGAAGILFSACDSLAAGLHGLTRVLGAWPGALVAAGASPWPVVAAALGAGALALATPPPRTPSPDAQRGPWRGAVIAFGAAAAVLACGSVLATAPLSPPPGSWWLVVLDVGQGDALAIADANGWWLVDAGPRSPHWDAGEGVVLPFLRWAGVRELEAVALTHDDGDHTGGARALGRGVRVRRWLGPAARPGVPGPCARYAARGLARGNGLPFSPGARVLWPPAPGEPGDSLARRGDNAAALVLELGAGRGRALLMADADSLVEGALDPSLRPALLKAGHHGSGSSSGARFLETLRPLRAAISCGAHNPYGHPSAGTLARLAAVGAIADRTDHDGALWYELDSSGVRRIDWRADPPRGARRRTPCASAPGAGPATAPRER